MKKMNKREIRTKKTCHAKTIKHEINADDKNDLEGIQAKRHFPLDHH